jgi:hypothetical protein
MKCHQTVKKAKATEQLCCIQNIALRRTQTHILQSYTNRCKNPFSASQPFKTFTKRTALPFSLIQTPVCTSRHSIKHQSRVRSAWRVCTLRHAERDAVMFEVTKGELSLRIWLHINCRQKAWRCNGSCHIAESTWRFKPVSKYSRDWQQPHTEMDVLQLPFYNWLPVMLSIATKFQYVNSLFIFFLTRYMFRPLRAIFTWDIQLDIPNGLFLQQRIRCTYAIWCKDVTCCTSVLRLCIPNTCYQLNVNIKL